MKFRKKPVTIDAWPARSVWLAARDNWVALPAEIKAAYEGGGLIFAADHISIQTLEGALRCNLDDMIIMGVKGEFYSCKPDIFAKTYEAVP